MFRLLALLMLLPPMLLATAMAQRFDIPHVTISGGDLAHDVHLAPADADAFRRRLNQLPRLEAAPDAGGTHYIVTSAYWRTAIELEDEEEEAGLAVLEAADYYPDGGFVRLTVGEDDVWVVINLRQRAILDRYVRLANDGLTTPSPSTIQVLAAAAAFEAFSVEAGISLVDAEVAASLFAALAEANPDPFVHPRVPPDLDTGSYWLTVTLLEGRKLSYFYDGATLTESLGTERYDASSVAETLASLAPASMPSIQHQDPPGSRLWWPVMIGSGLIAIAVAVWLRRLDSRRQASGRKL